jgi:hypothetical protein
MDFNNPKKKKVEEQPKKKDKKVDKSNILSDDELIELFADEEITHIIELPMYPHDFYHYQGLGNKRVTDDEINMWIEECVLYLEQEQDEFICTAQSGDTKVMVMRVFDDAEMYHYLIEVYKERYTIEITPEEL